MLFFGINATFVICGSHICDALRDLVPFVQLKKREKHPSRNVTFCKVARLKRDTVCLTLCDESNCNSV